MSDLEFLAELLKEPEFVPRKLQITTAKPAPQQYDPIFIQRTIWMICIYQQGRQGERCTNKTHYLFQGLPFCWEHLAIRFDYFLTHNGEPWRYADE